VGGHGGGLFEDTAIFQIIGDAGGAKAVIADACADPGGLGAAVDHFSGVAVGERPLAELFRDPANRWEEGGLGVAKQARLFDVDGKVVVKRVVTGHVMDLAALFQEADPEPVVSALDILDLKRQRRTDTCIGLRLSELGREIITISGSDYLRLSGVLGSQ